MKKEKNKFFIALSVFIGTISLSFFGLSYFLLGQLTSAQEDYRSNRIELSEVEKRSDQKNDLKRELDDVRSEIEKIRGAFLSERDTLELIQQIEDMAVNNGNSYAVKGTQEIKDPRTGAVKEIDFSVNVQGNFAGIVGFLRDVRSLPYLINIRQTDMRMDEGNISMDTTLKIYLQ